MSRANVCRAALAFALLLPWAGAAPSAAQTPATATTASESSPGPRARPAAAPAGAAVSPGPRAPQPDLPSTVSPAIARFMREGGRNLLPSPPPPAAPAVAQGRRAVPSTTPPAPPPPAANPRGALRGNGLPPGRPPSPATPGRPAAGAGLATTGPSPLATGLLLKAAPLEPTDLRFPINLATALRLADARPLIVAAAQAGVWVAEAQLTLAKVLWVPTAMFGMDYIRHDGGGPDFNKGIMTAPSVNYFMGGVGANLFINLTDAYYEPLVARQVLNAAHWEIQTAKNDALMQTADAYFRVHQYRGMYAGALYTVERGRDLVDRIANLSRELVPTVEVDRARNILADLEQRAVSARQEWRVASADLTQVLRLDPRAVVVPLEHDHAQVTLIDPGRSFDDLMPIALNNRPELASRRALVQAAEVRVRQEKARPLVPIVMLNGFQHANMFLQAGLFGLGPNSSLNQFRGRDDVSVQLMWQLEGLGIGNLARIKGQRGNESRAVIELRKAQDMVAADVNRALARVQSAAARVVEADRALRTGIITFNGHLEGLEQTRRLGNVLVLTFRPQEAVYSLDLLSLAFNEYFTTVAEYNRAQFELFHALGYPAHEVTSRLLPGAPQPVQTARPPYLPPVGNGPPPATR
jgi:outer membrane protein TolC